MLKNFKILLMLCFAFSLYSIDDHIAKNEAMQYVDSVIKEFVGIKKDDNTISNEILYFIQQTKMHLSQSCAKFTHWFSFTPYYLHKDLYEGSLAAIITYVEETIALYAREEIPSIVSDLSLYATITSGGIKNIKNEFLAMLIRENENGFKGVFRDYVGRALRNKIIDALLEVIRSIQPQDGKEIIYNPLECELCMDAYSATTEKKVLDCNHLFCKNCLIKWKETLAGAGSHFICPNCKNLITDEWVNKHLVQNIDFRGQLLLIL